METKKILIACTGSVATIKIGEIINKLQSNTVYKFEVSISKISEYVLHQGILFSKTKTFSSSTQNQIVKSLTSQKMCFALISDKGDNNDKCATFYRSQWGGSWCRNS